VARRGHGKLSERCDGVRQEEASTASSGSDRSVPLHGVRSMNRDVRQGD